MYTTCIHCHQPLGANEVVEAFPVGRRLAFDAAKGRLWVVCRGCERWNLSPLEERWEAIETCERLFRDARRRVSTDNVGLAKLPEGLELVRIGSPQRPEFAAWRYGDQFGRRRRAMYVRGGVAAVAVGAVAVAGSAAGFGVAGFWVFGKGLVDNVVNGRDESVVARIPWIGRLPLEVERRHLRTSAILRADDGVRVALEHRSGNVVLEGAQALQAARLLLPHANHKGGSRSEVQQAVAMLERIREPDGAVRQLATVDLRHADADRPLGLGFTRRLALEMALHEEEERRALEGELAALEAAWQQAEEIAAIADALLVPGGVQRMLDRLRARVAPGTPRER